MKRCVAVAFVVFFLMGTCGVWADSKENKTVQGTACNIVIQKNPDILVHAFRGFNGWVGRWSLDNIGTRILRNMKIYVSEAVKGNVVAAFDSSSFYFVIAGDTFYVTGNDVWTLDCSALELPPNLYFIEFYAAVLDSGKGFNFPEPTIQIDSVVYDLGHGGLERYEFVPVISQEVIIDWVVPVELSWFTYQVKQDSIVCLDWRTTTETNNYGFEIQLKSNSPDRNWERKGFVRGNGTTMQPHWYSFQDTLEVGGKFLYRLKQIDTDGSFSFSPEVSVEVQGQMTCVEEETPKTLVTEYTLYQNYPNPFNPSTTIRFNLPKASNVRLMVFNIDGQLVADLASGQYRAGEHKIQWDASSLSNGIYMYHIQAGEFRACKKMVLTK